MVGQLVQARGRNEGRQALDEGERFEDEVGCAIAEGRAQFMHDAAVGREGEAFVREGRASDVPAQMFETIGLARFDSYGGMQAETIEFRAQFLDDDGPAGDGQLRDPATLHP